MCVLRKILYLLLGVSLLLTGCNHSSNVKEVTYDGGLIINKGEDFKKGKSEGVELNAENEIILEENAIEGKYSSPVINCNNFREMVSSWNVDTPEGTKVELSFQVKIEDEWSMWFSYGKWSSNGSRGSVRDQRDKIANMAIDTIEVLWGKDADAFRYNISLTRKDSNIDSPKVKTIYAALKLSEEIAPAFAENKNWMVELDVPERSQMIVPEIGSVICSPTSLSMVLEYYGYDIDTEEVAAHVLDNEVNIYGNWSYNVAYAGTKGLSSYVARFASSDEIKDKIADGIPVIASIKTNSENTIKGAPQTYPSGHLLVVRGFTIKDGEEYVIVNDPAAPDNSTVRREYKLSGFEKAWNKIVYIVTPNSK